MGQIATRLNGRTELFTVEDCIPKSSLEGNFENQIVVISPNHVKNVWFEQYHKPEFQLFLAKGGFGCDPDKMGTTVYGRVLEDGEVCRFERGQISGILKPELVEEYGLEEFMK